MQADYVVVGGGSAGCVLANRLSANPKNTVVLIEAGPKDDSAFIHMPAGIIPVIRSDTYNWKYWTAPEANMGNRPMFWPRGRTLGGSSSINAMCYIRGHAWDYDQWAALGCAGWSYADVLPWFRKMENFEPANGAPDAYHGVGGPLNVTSARFINPLMPAFVAAAEQAGMPPTTDFNGASQEGVGYYHTMQKGGQRCSNADAYLHPIKDRPNLTVLTGQLAEQVLIENQRAVGVRLQGGRMTVRARKEVVLTAGAVGSPQLLQLSGIGPGALLQSLGIPVLVDAPEVGENLQDHLDIHVTVEDKTRAAISLHPGALGKSMKALWQYSRERQGELTSNLAQAGAFWRSCADEPIPDVQFHCVPFAVSSHGQDLSLVRKHWAVTLMACDLRPKSRGSIHLDSKDPSKHPRIAARYLSFDSELQRLKRAFAMARQIFAQPAFANVRGAELEPGPNVGSDADIEHYIRSRAETIYHPVGTCRMGSDAASVVDTALRVRGVAGLRVADASIMPTLIGGNTNAPTTMIAERAAALMLGELSL